MLLNFIYFLKQYQTLVKIIIIAVLIIAIVALIVYAIKKEKQLTKREKIKRITFISILSAFSFVLYMVKFNLPFIFPSFLEVHFSNVPVLIGGFLYGPIAGVIVVIVRMILKVPFTSTAGVGEFADLIIGIAIVLVSSIIYQKNKSKKGAVIALISSSLTWTIIAFISNWLILIPFYIYFYFGGYDNIQALIGLMKVIPGVNENNYMIKYLIYGNLPFNLLLSSAVSIVTFLVYKRVSIIAHDLDGNEEIVKANVVEISHK